MLNSPDLDGKYLGTITKDFVIIADTLKEAAYQLKVRKISDYPIFVISKESNSIGQLLIGKDEAGLKWDVNFSFLEDFISRMLVKEDRIDAFKQTFKDPEEFCCLFVIDEGFQNFLFIPYPED